MSDRAVLNCGKDSGVSLLRLVRPCDRTWNSLTPTDEERVSYCDGCDSLVYKVANTYEARSRAKQGECIAVPPAVAESARLHGPGEGGIRIGGFDVMGDIDRALADPTP